MRFRNFFRLLVRRTVAISVLSAIVVFGEEPRTAADAPVQVANSQQNEVAQAIKQLADEMRQERRPPDSAIPFGILGPLIALVAFAFELYQRRHHERTGVILFGGLLLITLVAVGVFLPHPKAEPPLQVTLNPSLPSLTAPSVAPKPTILSSSANNYSTQHRLWKVCRRIGSLSTITSRRLKHIPTRRA